MKLIKHKSVEIGIVKAGKGQPFNWKPEVVPYLDNLHTVKWKSDSPHREDVYDTVSYYVPMYIQIFWLGRIIYIELKKEKLGATKMVRYENTHLAEIDKALNEK